jgi:cerevisin
VAPYLLIRASTDETQYHSMASPHVAGLAAYFLSLYPTSFQPTEFELVDEDLTFLQRSAQFVFGTSADEFANKARQGLALAPIPKLLTPKALKSAMIKVGSKGLLTVSATSISDRDISLTSSTLQDMPAGTPNILIFNNFTSSALVDILREVSLEQ